ncbi:TonB-dependent receptor [Massilia pseudoviolaceinigra]|uniref:TonB-dependent receptor n=1 Tax=Massilia pseudoviolaceinigra TaxID=3057165 RepID=UPI002796BC65|nr:TonB-dependent receptor [Massilia sp. CCM 9206]MDQ1922640.1 TonB-dependent receptor [Massilia sp. CCM 9206]
MQPTLKPLCLLVMQAVSCFAYAAAGPDPAPLPEQPAAEAVPAPVQPAPPLASAPAAVLVETFGRGQSRQVQNISRIELSKLLPGTSPLKALERLPGVSFQAADSFGIYEWSVRFNVRGFSQSQLGFTLDNVPLGDMSYGNNNGLQVTRAVSSENVVRVSLSQGAGALGTASTSNLGGTVQFVMQEPHDEFGTAVVQTFGANDTSRTFARVDTGELPGGGKFYLSGTRQRAGKWKGEGSHDQEQFNFRFQQPIGDHSLSGFYNYSDRIERDYQDLSLAMLPKVGYDFDYYAPDWERAVAAARGVYSGGVTTKDDAYFLGRGLRKDGLGSLVLDLDFGAGFGFKGTLYTHNHQGQGHWYTPYAASSATVPISIRASEYDIHRRGVVLDLSWERGMHALKAGMWSETNAHDFSRNFYAVGGPEDTGRFLTAPSSRAFFQSFDTSTRQFYLQDTISLADGRFKVNAGFKSPKVTIDATSVLGTRAAGSITAEKSFLPQAGAIYALNKDDEIFGSASKNMRAYQPGAAGPFSQTQAAFDLGKANLKPETSTSVDLGYRFRRNTLQGSVAVYRADFSDRQLSVATCSGIAGCPSTLVNVGKVLTTGMEASAMWKMSKDFSWFNSVTYNDSTYKSNYMDNGVLIKAAGKQVVDTPRTMLTSELNYENKNVFGRVGVKHTGKRYYTFLNDAGVDSYLLASMSAGYKLQSVWRLKDVTFQLHVNNLFDKQYISTIGSNGFLKSDPNGTYATLLTGAPRQVFFSIGAKI